MSGDIEREDESGETESGNNQTEPDRMPREPRRVGTRLAKILRVLEDNDAEKLKAIGFTAGEDGLSDAEIEKMVQERNAARARRDFAASDRIRKELAERGIILEDTKDGKVRWKHK